MEDISAFDEEGAVHAAPKTIAELRELAGQAIAMQASLDEFEEVAKAMKANLNTLKTKTIPDALAQAGTTSFTLDNGTVISVEDFVSASIPKEEEKRKAFFEALIEQGGEALIKSDLSVTFEKRQHNMALDLCARLKEDGFEPVVEESVHTQSLAAFVREKIKGGEEVDYGKLNCFVGKTTKFKAPPKKKS